MPPVFALSGDLTLNSAVFASDVAKASRSLRTGGAKMNRTLALMDKGWGRNFAGIARMTTSMIGLNAVVAGAAGLAGGGFLLLINQQAQLASQTVETADKIGLTAESLQELRFAASEVEVKQNTLDMAMQRFSRRVGEAAQGTGELKDDLKKYNIEVTDAEGRQRDLVDILKDYADVVASAGSEQEQLRLSFKAFDSEGAALVNLMRRGSAGIEEFSKRARTLGLVMKEDLIRESARAATQLKTLGQVLQVNLGRVVAQLAPEIIALTQGLIGMAPAVLAVAQRLSPAQFAGVEELNRRIRSVRGEIELFMKIREDLIEQGNTTSANRDALARSAQRIGDLRAEFKQLVAQRDKAMALGDALREMFKPDTVNAYTEAIKKTNEALQFELDQLGRTELGQELYTRAKSAGIEINREFVEGTRELTAKVLEERAATAALAETLGFAQQALKDNETAADKLVRRKSELLQLVRDGKIDWNEYAAGVKKARDEYEEADVAATRLGDAAEEVGTRTARSLLQARNSAKGLTGVLENLGDILLDVLANLAIAGFIDEIKAIDFNSGTGSDTIPVTDIVPPTGSGAVPKASLNAVGPQNNIMIMVDPDAEVSQQASANGTGGQDVEIRIKAIAKSAVAEDLHQGGEVLTAMKSALNVRERSRGRA